MGINDIGLALLVAGLWLTLAACVLAAWRRGKARVRRSLARPANRRPRGWKPLHRGRPALVAAAATFEGATEDWSPDATVTAAGISEELLTDEEREQLLHDEIEDAVYRATADVSSRIDNIIGDFLTAWAISWDDVRAWKTDTAAQQIVAAVGGDFDALRERIEQEETPTGEYPIVIPRQRAAVTA